jgi:hypothetical protein
MFMPLAVLLTEIVALADVVVMPPEKLDVCVRGDMSRDVDPEIT